MTQLRLINPMANTEDAIKTAKEKLPNVTPTPPGLHAQATAHELKSRLNWGEPALTILDVRDRDSFNDYRIQGAMSMPMDTLADVAKSSLELKRDIYVYGSSDEETASAANVLRQAGFHRVAELKGGLSAWKEIGGSVDGRTSVEEPPTPGAYNVASRLKEFSEEKAKEKRQDRASV
jgi:rhodanese-related sulfurtransferase